MCELFGVCSKEGMTLNEYLNIFYGRSDKHPHGWGLACLHGNEAMIKKEPIQASKSAYLQEVLAQPIVEENAFAHIRYATIGNIDYRNCHPFSLVDKNGRRWTLIHNGTIFDYSPLEKYVQLQSGETDSERILLYLIEEINGREAELGRPFQEEERFRFLDAIISDMAAGNKLNLLLYDGEIMYVHTNYQNSLHYLEEEGVIIFSTAPLDEKHWQPVCFTTLLAYQNGALKYQGTNHGNEYIEKEENIKFLYQIFADL